MLIVSETTLEAIAIAILGLNGTLIAALIWMLKTMLSKLFGSDSDPGIINRFNETFNLLSKGIQENTQAIHELRDHQRQHAQSQNTNLKKTNDTLAKILETQNH